MTQAEKETFLSGVHVGVLSLNQDDRAPLTVPIWYDYQPGGSLIIITGATSRKAKLLALGSKIGFAAQQEDLPYKYVSIEGDVTEIRPTQEQELLDMAIRYLGEEMGTEYAKSDSVEGQITASIQPTKWLAVDYGKAS